MQLYLWHLEITWVNTKHSWWIRHLRHKLFDLPQKEIGQTDNSPLNKKLEYQIKFC